MGESGAARPDATDVLSLVADPECRAILEATATAAKSVGELGTACDLPRSTAYRKVKALVEAGLLDERVRIQPERRNPNEYLLRAGKIALTLDGAGVSLPDYEVEVGDGGSEPADGSDWMSSEPRLSPDGGAPCDADAQARRRSSGALRMTVSGRDHDSDD